MDPILINTIAAIISSVIIFLILHLVVKISYNRLKIYFNEKIDVKNFLPEEELQNQRQIFRIIMIVLCVGFLIFTITDTLLNFGIMENYGEIYAIIYSSDFNGVIFIVLDIIISVYLSLNLDLKNSHKDRVMFILLFPYTSLIVMPIFAGFTDIMYFIDSSFNFIFDFNHSVMYIYFIHVYYKKFMKHTKNTTLGKTIVLLVALLLAATIITIVTERVSLLDSVNMVSNAFVSNGYMVMGTTTIGKLNVLIIIWGGYILSGVGTATLTAAILMRHYDVKLKERKDKYAKQFDELEELIEFNNGELG